MASLAQQSLHRLRLAFRASGQSRTLDIAPTLLDFLKAQYFYSYFLHLPGRILVELYFSYYKRPCSLSVGDLTDFVTPPEAQWRKMRQRSRSRQLQGIRQVV
jgi:hypothetical protein